MEERRVRPLDDAPREPPQPPGLSVLLTVLAVVAIIGFVVVAVTSADTPEAPQPAAPASTFVQATTTTAGTTVPVGPVMPDVVGVHIDKASDEVGNVTEIRWRASDIYEVGFVVAQEPGAGEAMAAASILTLSAGGPAIRFTELPPHIREWVIDEPGFSRDEPILVTETAAGHAYKTDGLLFGECPAVQLAYRTYPDPVYLDACVAPGPRVALPGVLPDGTPYVVSGLPRDRYEVLSTSGIVMIETTDGARALGIHTWGTGLWTEPVVQWAGNRLRMAAGAIWLSIDVYADIPLTDAERQELAESIVPRSVDGHFVLDLAPPLRFQGEDEVPNMLAVDYGTLVVAKGCSLNARSGDICDPTQQIALRPAAQWLLLDDLAIEVGGDLADGFRTIDLADAGLTFEYPAAWNRPHESMTSSTALGTELITVGTGRLRPGVVTCVEYPENALADLAATDVLITLHWIQAEGGGALWPGRFDDATFPRPVSGIHANLCSDRTDLDIRQTFLDHGLGQLYVLIAFGDDASIERRNQVWTALESLRP